ncbi:GNAT family N-acetyltransferase [Deinococcus radiotolerans]|uniref:N-acetyltransferase domain-containing protein n=1 Tax=Deinococcus radiotolerans TaxID=1309407 RepID=A0ABQ2FMP1_9DEIO|nr:GNAT family N-acetyltransferase [Deinococcus radiotolerans]GGL05335.1 hypothetical protein GCM10010844_25120 [Deinococcus radiotolerans]
MILTAHVTPRADLTPRLEAGLRCLLIAAYPQFADFWAGASYWGSEPDWHLWLAGVAGTPVAQLGCGQRVAEVGGRDVTLVGVGGVATHPACQGRGVGRRLLRALHAFLLTRPDVEFAFLQCREEVVPFYERGGFLRVPNAAHYLDPDEGQWVTDSGPTLILPVHAALAEWPVGETVNLRGTPW